MCAIVAGHRWNPAFLIADVRTERTLRTKSDIRLSRQELTITCRIAAACLRCRISDGSPNVFNGHGACSWLAMSNREGSGSIIWTVQGVRPLMCGLRGHETRLLALRTASTIAAMRPLWARTWGWQIGNDQ